MGVVVPTDGRRHVNHSFDQLRLLQTGHGVKAPLEFFSREPGDHLTREEFERRFNAMPGLKKAELIEGVVYMPSPVRWNNHAHPHMQLTTWLGVYEANTPGVEAGGDGTIRL